MIITYIQQQFCNIISPSKCINIPSPSFSSSSGLLSSVSSRDSFLLDEFQPYAYFQCYKQSGYNGIILQSQSWDQTRIDECVENIMNAKNAGLAVELLYQPCRSWSPEDDLNYLFNNVRPEYIDRLWIEPFFPQSNLYHCQWKKYSPESNCLYLQNFISISKAQYGVPVDMITYSEEWIQIFKTLSYCPEVSKVSRLWWIPEEYQNFKPDFANYQQIGGWEIPYMKSYNGKTICQKLLFVNYYE